MKKIMFSDKYGLTDAVLSGRKTMTRRMMINQPAYNLGDVVAIAQNYKRAGLKPTALQYQEKRKNGKVVWRGDMEFRKTAGWTNKMFVLPDLMPHRIYITDIKVGRLQDISEEDCLKEGVEKWMDGYIVTGILERGQKRNVCFDTPREAFAALIDRISGKGIWQRNPWVYAYEFELLR